MSEIQEFLIYMQIKYMWVVILVYVVQRGILALYYKAMEYDKWWAALIPFGHLYCKHELGAVRWYYLIPTAVLSMLAGYTMDVIFLTLCFAGNVLTEFLYSRMFIDSCNVWLWTFIPFLKYIIMIKEVVTYAGNESR